MKELDFLPKSFHDAARRRRQNRKNAVLAVMLAAAFTGLHGVQSTRLRSAEAALGALRGDSEVREAEQIRLEVLSMRQNDLQRQAELLNKLDDDAPLDAVLAELTRLLSPSMRLTSVVLKVEPAQAVGKEVPDPLLNRDLARVTVTGLANTDVEVGIFFGKLSASPLFMDAALGFSRDPGHADHQRPVREFELSFRVKRVSLDGAK